MKIIEVLKKQPCICITPYSYKKEILKELNDSFYHVRFYTKEEIKKLLCYEYHPLALWKYAKKYHLTIENAKIELENLYYIMDNSVFKTLYQKKEWLKEQKLLICHPGFVNLLKSKKIFIYGYAPYELKKIVKNLNVTYIEEEIKSFVPNITEYETIEQEVVGVAEKITKLLQEGISINQIKISNINSDYESIVFKIFRDFHLPFVKKNNHSLFEYAMIQDFLKSINWDDSFKEIYNVLERLEQKYPKENPFYSKIYENLIGVINRYYDESLSFYDVQDILIYELKHRTIKEEQYINVIREVSFEDYLFHKGDYIFLLGVNLGEFPPIYEDQDYLSDEQKEMLFLPTSLEMTKGIEQKITNKIRNLEHVFISYKKKSPFKEYLPSTLIEKLKEEKNITVESGEYQYTNHSYNTYLLNSSLDDYINYNVMKKELKQLYGLEPLYYRNYDNQFTGIDENIIKEKLPFCLLSYTGMQKFFECPFKYYMNSILKIDKPFKETPSLLMGNLFHSVLEKYFKTKDNLEQIIDEELKKIKIEPKEKQEFYLKKYKDEMIRLIHLMERQQSRSSFQADYFEETVYWDETENITFRIFGKIDKILTFQDKNNSYIIVVDYKTGSASSDLSKIIYGMNMQLFMYLYLISNDERFKNYELGGAYIESISSSIPNYTEGKTLEELLWEQSKLDGFSLKRTSYVEALDKEYLDSSYVKGIRVKKDGEFYNNTRLLEKNTLEQLLEIVRKNIDIVKQTIEKGNFTITPKKFSSEIGDSVSSCAFCNYRDVCYLKNKNIITLKEYKNLEFLEGGEMDDTN